MTKPVLVVMVMLASCKGDDTKAPTASAPTSTPNPVEATPEATKPELASKPKERVKLESLGLSIEVPAGTLVTPPRDADEASRRANLAQGDFMVNVFAVDEYSTPSFAEAQKTSPSDKLIASIRAEETPTGWITMKELESAIQEKVVVEVSVRTVVAGKKWDCAVAAPNRAYADLALTACLTLSTLTPSDGAAAAGPAPAPVKAESPPTTKATKPATKATKSAVTTASASASGGLDPNVIRTIVRRSTPRFQRCHEQGSRAAVRVTTSFVIGADGKVSAATAAGGDSQLSQCIASTFRALSFPRPSDGKPVKINYPLVFDAAP